MAKKRKPTLRVRPSNFDNDKYTCIRVYERPDGLPAIVMMSKHANPPRFMVMSGRKPNDYIKAKQKNGKPLYAEEIYNNTWGWLIECKCDHLFVPAIVEEYAMSFARWIQCEEAISEYGFLTKHPTTGQAITSPYVSMSQSYMKQATQQWSLIYEIVKANCTVNFEGATPYEDAMELLLKSRERRF